jgi:hypothetical protein
VDVANCDTLKFLREWVIIKIVCGSLGALSLVLGGCATPAAIAPATAQAATEPLEVRVDERVELLAIIFRLAGAQEYSGRQVALYADAIDKYFGPHRDHPAVTAARELRAEYGIGHNAVADLAVHLSPIPELKERVPLEDGQLDPRWRPGAARAFLHQIRAFAAETNAAGFFAQQRPLYHVAERRMRTLAAHEADLPWVQAYFGGAPDERLIIVPAPANGQVAYGPRFHGSSGEREFYAIINVWQVDEDGWPAFSVSTAYTIVHEFGHSYVTPLIVERYDDLQPAGEALLVHFGDEMRSIGYSQGDTILHESIIRAAVARYKLAHMGEATARGELTRQRRLGFLWIDEVYDLLAEYEQNRDHYPTFRDFYPVVRGYFAGLAPRVSVIAAAYEKQRPRIIEFSLPNGSTNVDPDTKTITMKFDRPMRRSWGFRTIHGQTWPGRSTAMDESGTVLTLQVELEPNTYYEIAPLPTLFQSQEGVLLSPTSLIFTTGPTH